MTLTRRQMLLASAGLAATGAGAAALTPQVARACEAVHAAASAKYDRLSRGVALAGDNVLSNLRDMVCPCCSEPLVLFGGKLAL